MLERYVVLVAMCLLQNITSLFYQVESIHMRSFRAIETDEKPAEKEHWKLKRKLWNAG